MNGRMRWLWVFVGGFFLFSPVHAQPICENPTLRDSVPCNVEIISWVDVFLTGTAEEIDISGENLERLIRLRLRNDLSMIPHEVIKMTDAWEEADYDLESQFLKEKGYVNCRIWTVGDQYPIAYNIECNLGSYGITENDYISIETEYLGYAGLDGIKNVMDETIRDAVADMSSQFIEMRGNMIAQD